VRDAAEELVAALVAVDSVNPALVPGAAGEAELAARVAAWCRGAGLEAELDEPAPGRPSVLARAPGRGGGRTLLLCAHLDTVGVEGMAEPFAPRVQGARLHGRGAYDMKGGLAAVLLAAARAAREGLAGDVLVAAVSDEEHASLGVRSLLRRVRADAAIVTEPTQLDVCVAHKGFAWLEVEATGRAAHGSRPDLGVDAIAHLGPVLVGLRELDRTLRARAGHPLLGPGSVHASLVRGGQELSSYPARAVLEVERRTVPGESRALVEAELQALLDGARAAEPDARLGGRVTLVREPFAVDPDAEVVRALRRCATEACGREPALVGDPAWMDAAFLSAAGIPTAVFGPRGAGAHAVEEWVDLDSVARCAETLVAVARELCGRAAAP
jgi:acetylornithine deacetylase